MSSLRVVGVILPILLGACGLDVVEDHRPPLDEQIVRPEETIRSAPAVIPKGSVILDFGYSMCSGIIVARKKILTSHHCFEGWDDASRVKVLFGVDRRTITNTRRGVGVAKLHDRLDLAVFSIDEAIPGGYAPIPLWGSDFSLKSGTKVALAGYGSTAADVNNAGNFLRWGYANFREFFPEFRYDENTVYRSILAFSNGNKLTSASCGGDSGGPIVAEKNGEWRLVGVVSGSPVECGLNSETLAADVRPNHQWILN